MPSPEPRSRRARVDAIRSGRRQPTKPVRTGGAAAWTYARYVLFNVVVFAGAGLAYASVYRPLGHLTFVIVPAFAVAGATWGWWLAKRTNAGYDFL